MINLNTTLSTNGITQAPSEVAKTTPNKALENKVAVNEGASTVVDLQTKVGKSNAQSSLKVDSSNATSFVADLASLLSKSNGSVQANLSSFDAASLLA